MTLAPTLFPVATYDADRRALQVQLPRVPLDIQLQLAEGFHQKYREDAHANYLLAVLHAQTKMPFNAIPFAQKAVQLSQFAPEQVAFLFSLYLDFRFYEQIGALIGHIERDSKTSPALELQIANYYQGIGKLEKAVVHFKTAEQLFVSPADKNSVRWNLYEVLRQANHMEEAKALLASFAADPGRRVALLFERAQLEEGKETEQTAQEIKRLLASASLNNDDKERLFLASGKLHERKGDYDNAFLSWQQARALVKAVYDEIEYEKELRETVVFYNEELFKRVLPYASASNEPIFVVGMPRSGTTLLAQILAAHPDVASGTELVRIKREATTFRRKYQVPRGLRQLQMDAERGELTERTRDYLDLAHLAATKPAKHFVDKTPEEFWSAGYIHMLFPRAKFINLNRHPGDVFISTYQNAFTHGFAYAFDQRTFAHYYIQRDKLMSAWTKLFPQVILDVHYERLVQSPEEEVRRILEFIELPWNPACLKFFELPSLVRTFSRDQVRSAINTKSVGRWKNYAEHLSPLFDALAELGYSQDGKRA